MLEGSAQSIVSWTGRYISTRSPFMDCGVILVLFDIRALIASS